MPDEFLGVQEKEERGRDDFFDSAFDRDAIDLFSAPNRSGGYDRPSTPISFGREMHDQGQRNQVLDALGSFAWNLADTGSFGIAGLIDKDDYLEDLLTGGEDYKSTGKMIGGSLGTLAGFLVPMKVVGAGLKTAVRLGAKAGTSRVAKRTAKDVAAALTKDAKFIEKTPSLFRNEVEALIMKYSKEAIFKGKNNVIKNYTARAAGMKLSVKGVMKKGITEEQYLLNAAEVVPKNIQAVLGKLSGKKAIDISKGSVDEAVAIMKRNYGFINGKLGKGVPIDNLQQLFAKQLGNGKVANALSHGIEEGMVFAGVESLLNMTESLEGKAEWDPKGAAMQGFMFGNLLGWTKLIKGGNNVPIMKGVFKTISQKLSIRPKFKGIDATTKEGVEQVWTHLNHISTDAQGKKFIGDIATNVKGFKFKEHTDISQLYREAMDAVTSKSAGYAKVGNDFKKILSTLETNGERAWRREFLRIAPQDLQESAKRWILGGALFGGPTLLDPNVTPEEVAWHTMLGAVFTRHRKTFKWYDGANWNQTKFDLSRPSNSEKMNRLK